MTSEEFRIWIKGYTELSTEAELTAQQIRIIRNHANLVYVISKKSDVGIDKFVASLNEGVKRESFISLVTDLHV